MFDNASNFDLIVTPDPNIKEKSEVSTSECFLPRAPEIHGVNNLILSLRIWQLYFERQFLHLTNLFVFVVILPTLLGVNWRQNSRPKNY